ncbi:hypothetical protein [Bradyrhizobium iriomotense]|uniref:hypothetical protein n=1 Tax=Bradyrhizobium iriomotense TaxID=441950 RepID=UPI0024E0416E|nr:hypothetical protein [Bradyrhizobium iriomotense]
MVESAAATFVAPTASVAASTVETSENFSVVFMGSSLLTAYADVIVFDRTRY